MNKRYQSIVVLVMSLLFVTILISCGDEESVFNSGKVKAYIQDIDITISSSNASISFDKGIYEYTVYTSGRPLSCTFTVLADNADSIIMNGNSTVISGSGFPVNLNVKGDSEFTFTAKKAGAQDTLYRITFKHNEEDARLAYLRPSAEALNSKTFITPTYRPQHKTYSMQFYTNQMGIDVKPFNSSASLLIDGVINTTYSANFSFPSKGDKSVSIQVISADLSVTNSWILTMSRIVFTYSGPFIEYSQSPYGFTGNIKKVRDGIVAAGAATSYIYDVPEVDRLITGVVTASPYYIKFVSGPGQPNVGHNECFFVEDDEHGFAVAHETAGEDLGLEIGDKIQFRIIRGVHNYQMPIAVIDPANKTIKHLSKVSKIKYSTGSYTDANARGKVFMWQGIPQTGILSYDEGTFSGSLMYQGDDSKDWAMLFVDYLSHRFYGPVMYGYSKSKIIITHPGQIHYNDDKN